MSSDEAGEHPSKDAVQARLRADIASLLPDLRGYARFLARDPAVADDVVQDGLVRALAALEQFQAGTNLKAWLFTIVRNAFYETARRRRRELSSIGNGDLPQRTIPPDAERRAEIRDLQSTIWTLPPLLREALILVGAQEMSYEEAATVCGVPVGTMKARVSRARTSLAAAMQRERDDGVRLHGSDDT